MAFVLWTLTITCAAADVPSALQTVPERTSFAATSRYQDVVQFCQALSEACADVRLTDAGRSAQGRQLPVLILGHPAVATPDDARRAGKLVVFAMGNVHAGEVDGKEALQILARDLIIPHRSPVLKDLVLLFAPIVNPDGNELISPKNRPHQSGPQGGVGVRSNAQQFDLNRDFVKLDSPEARGLVRFWNDWDPAIVIDTHTTNGSLHRYALTYDGPRHPAAPVPLIAFTRDTFLPEAGRSVEQATGYRCFFYGNFNKDRTRWESYPALPRYACQYVGLRNRISILTESYAYAPFRDRIAATQAFVKQVLVIAARRRSDIAHMIAEADRAARRSSTESAVPLRHEPVASAGLKTVLAYDATTADRSVTASNRPQDYQVQYFGDCRPTLCVRKPFAYVIADAPACRNVVDRLPRHGIELEQLREDIELDVETYRVTKWDRAKRVYQGRQLTTVDVESHRSSRMFRAGAFLVRTTQRLGVLASYLLEPQAEDGLCAWGLIEQDFGAINEYPIARVPTAAPLMSGPAPLPEARKSNLPITFDTVFGAGPRPNFNGSVVSGLTWLDENERYLQIRNGQLHRVHPDSGRAEPFHDPAKMTEALAKLDGIDRSAAQRLARGPTFQMNRDRSAALFEHNDDLYYGRFDGKSAARLTRTAPREELAAFSPDGRFVSFVRGQNLFTVEVATQAERPLTTDGGAVSNGKADWVYFEELYHRNWNAHWWSPDSSRIAFLQFDARHLPSFTVVNEIPVHQEVERTPYPKAGDPNPKVRVGVVPVPAGPITWLDLSSYGDTSYLVTRIGWLPDSRKIYMYVQDRAQTWLDFLIAEIASPDPPKRLFREKTSAWVDDPGPARFLKNGSFVLPSERTGWRHLYLFDAAGKLIRPITSGQWEVRDIHLIDESGGWVYFSGTRDNPIGENLYRARLDGAAIERLTHGAGSHRVQLHPKGSHFFDTWSDCETPPQVRLFCSDGKLVRMIDSNPVHVRNEYLHGPIERVQIKTPDGFLLEATLLKPPGFDSTKKYPAWFMTYGGPHAPTVRDAWNYRWAYDQMLAQMGLIVFRCDPRSASGKGACSTWTAYRQLGVTELKDIETAIGWLTKFPYVDARRIGMSGHSYGGFMTAYAMTHSKLFAAGIAGAPVTDWRNYDTIYTERYMNTPQENPSGYELTSVVKAARNLHGRLLVIHGLMDDNVHVQNTMQFVDELQKADKDFELMIYPRSRHGIGGRHYDRLVVDFIRRSLRLAGP
jgi:dipeptidyl aminopeptidase/acylaminoacyl peptidase